MRKEDRKLIECISYLEEIERELSHTISDAASFNISTFELARRVLAARNRLRHRIDRIKKQMEE